MRTPSGLERNLPSFSIVVPPVLTIRSGGKTVTRAIYYLRRLDGIYLLFCAPLILALIYVLPPFQAPDEAAHFYRAIQLSHGDAAPVVAPKTYRTGAGGSVDTSAYRLVDDYCGIPNWSCKQQQRPVIRDILSPVPQGGGGDQLQVVPFSNTVVYLPVAHVAPAGAIFLARAAGLSPLGWLYAGRLANALIAIATAWCSLVLLRGKPAAVLIFAVGCLPMFASIAATLCADSSVIGFSMLLFAICFRIVDGQDIGWGLGLALVAAVFYASAAKLAYLPLSLIPLACAIGANRSKPLILGTAILAICAIGITGLWYLVIKDYVYPISQNPRVNPAAQIAYVRSHPVSFVITLIKSMILQLPYVWVTMIGRKLSDLKVLLPWVLVVLSSVVLLTGAAVSGRPNTKILLRGSIFLILAASATATFAFLYLQNSAVGVPWVEGYQGRYLIPLLPFAAFLVPPIERLQTTTANWFTQIAGVSGALAIVLLVVFLGVRTWSYSAA
jgi:uncharacterized membrane protein